MLKEVIDRFGVTQDEALKEILLFGKKTEEKVERSIALLEVT